MEDGDSIVPERISLGEGRGGPLSLGGEGEFHGADVMDRIVPNALEL